MLSSASVTAVMCVLVAAWVALQMLFLSDISQARAQDRLYAEFRAEAAAATAPIGPGTEPGAPVALLRVPSLGIEQVVVEGTASGDLLAGPGHLRSSVLPGQAGTSVVMGRGTTYGAPLADIGELLEGDRIQVVTGQGQITFKVLGVRRAGDVLPQPRPSDAARLVLVSGEGQGRLGALTSSEVVYVDAEAAEAFPTPTGYAPVVPEPEEPMGTEPGAVPLLALCLGALLAVTIGVIAARQRFHPALVWVISTPVVVAVAWATTDVVMRLLPNLL